MRLSVFTKLVLSGAMPLLGLGAETVNPPAVGNAFEIAPQAGLTLGKMHPAVSFDGKDTFLVVWEEGWDGWNGGTDIVAARVRSDGTCLDPGGIVICKAKDFQERPAVTFGEGHWLVVWQDIRGGKDYDLYGARVTPEGKCLDPDGAALFGGPGNQCEAALASSGKEFALAWSDFRSGENYEIYLGRVGADGKALDGAGKTKVAKRAGPGYSDTQPRLVRTGHGWLMTWISYDERFRPAPMMSGVPFVGLWSEQMAPLLEAGQPLARTISVHQPALAVNDGTGLAVWAGNWSGRGLPPPVTAVRIDASSGLVIAAHPNGPWPGDKRGVSDQHFALSAEAPLRNIAAAASAGMFLVVMDGQLTTDKRSKEHTPFARILGARVRAADGLAPDGIYRQAALIEISAGTEFPQQNPALAGGKDGRFLVVHEVDRGIGQRQLLGRFVDTR